ncbi:MAG: hypothetical protein KC649_00590, partial [Candidatus Omnitrophica bacterium]|nr:hypothetical protein [Candidatus Omnitrophota bacterium]
RKLIRKSCLHLKSLGFTEPLLYKMSPAVSDVMSDAYPELITSMPAISKTILKEEEAIWNILENKVPEAQIKIKAIALTCKPGQEAHASVTATRSAFEYYDTYGVPSEILETILDENHLKFDEELFESLLEEQRNRSRAGSNIVGNIFAVESNAISDLNLPATVFQGYEKLSIEGRVLALIHEGKSVSKLEKGQRGILISDQTSFYAEQGGQIGDTGVISASDKKFTATVEDTKKMDDVVLHHITVTGGNVEQDLKISMDVDSVRRARIMANHTATHLLHSALGKVLGNHVKQRGSLVSDDRLRFDFSHQESLTNEEISAVEKLVNAEIQSAKKLQVSVKNKKEAIAAGAVAFFGDKYGDKVRVVAVDGFSTELCGGTHVSCTDEITLFRIISESSIQLGVRRIEAVTSDAAIEYDQGRLSELFGLETDFNMTSADFIRSGEASFTKKLNDLSKRLKNKFQSLLHDQIKTLLKDCPSVNGTKKALLKLNNMDKTMMKMAADWITDLEPSVVAVIFSETESKPVVAAVVSSDLNSKGLNAGNLVKIISSSIGGNGGGKPQFAMGGGAPGQDLTKAIECAETLINEELNKS